MDALAYARRLNLSEREEERVKSPNLDIVVVVDDDDDDDDDDYYYYYYYYYYY
jgi:hypothetical protein